MLEISLVEESEIIALVNRSFDSNLIDGWSIEGNVVKLMSEDNYCQYIEAFSFLNETLAKVFVDAIREDKKAEIEYWNLLRNYDARDYDLEMELDLATSPWEYLEEIYA